MPTSSQPLRAGKAWLYEGGIRVPLIIKFPGHIPPGTKISEPVISTDLYPTILDFLNLPLQPKQHLDGLSLKSLIAGGVDLKREAIHFHFPHYHHINTMGPSGAIRQGDYKLIEVFETGELELYNLREDMEENHNLVDKIPTLAMQMRKDLKKWRLQSNAQLNQKNPNYDPDLDFRKK